MEEEILASISYINSTNSQQFPVHIFAAHRSCAARWYVHVLRPVESNDAHADRAGPTGDDAQLCAGAR